ncbi:hypothetical protein U1Q18_010257 [Sarracenia purpurea var. burkii]
MQLPPAHALQATDEMGCHAFLESESFSIGKDKPTKVLVNEDSLQKEKQISVDPKSLKESAYSGLQLSTHAITTSAKVNLLSLPTLPAAKVKFLTTSLPNSTTSSPQLSLSKLKKEKKSKNRLGPPSHRPHVLLSCQHSVALTHLHQLGESHLRRSKSCGEGGATVPFDEFDLYWSDANGGKNGNRHISSSFCSMTTNGTKMDKDGGSKIGEVKIEKDGGSRIGEAMDTYNSDDAEENMVKCGALCMFLPGYGKGKPVRPRKEEVGKQVQKEILTHVISRTVSLEKFECGSWTSSSAIIMDNIIGGDPEDIGDSTTNLLFDLPLELIQHQDKVNDADSAVRAAFVFDLKDGRGVRKTSNTSSRGAISASARNSHDSSSSRRVRFSTSSPTISNPTSPTSCITPRLRKARHDFNAFLQAQS